MRSMASALMLFQSCRVSRKVRSCGTPSMSSRKRRPRIWSCPRALLRPSTLVAIPGMSLPSTAPRSTPAASSRCNSALPMTLTERGMSRNSRPTRLALTTTVCVLSTPACAATGATGAGGGVCALVSVGSASSAHIAATPLPSADSRQGSQESTTGKAAISGRRGTGKLIGKSLGMGHAGACALFRQAGDSWQRVTSVYNENHSQLSATE